MSHTHWVAVFQRCDAKLLDAGTNKPLLLLCDDAVMHTCDDFSVERYTRSTNTLDFCSFRFSTNALRSSYWLVLDSDASHGARTATPVVEKLGCVFLAAPSADTALEFSHAVCVWSRGQRVWGNLQRFHGIRLGEFLHGWLGDVPHARNDETAIASAVVSTDRRIGVGIKGLGVSFASKHLRTLAPRRFAALGDVLSQGLGFALNVKGCTLFMRELRRFVATRPSDVLSDAKPTVAAVESGIFGSVRRVVRSCDDLTGADLLIIGRDQC